jgi:hypothetical protein
LIDGTSRTRTHDRSRLMEHARERVPVAVAHRVARPIVFDAILPIGAVVVAASR